MCTVLKISVHHRKHTIHKGIDSGQILNQNSTTSLFMVTKVKWAAKLCIVHLTHHHKPVNLALDARVVGSTRTRGQFGALPKVISASHTLSSIQHFGHKPTFSNNHSATETEEFGKAIELTIFVFQVIARQQLQCHFQCTGYAGQLTSGDEYSLWCQ